MFFNQLFKKYYEQISSVTLPGYKKSVGKFYLKDIQAAVEVIDNSNFQAAIDHSRNTIRSFENRYSTTFKPLALPEVSIKNDIKNELEPEWSKFFKTVSVLIDNHDFYKAIESSFKRRCEGIVNAVEILARDLKLIADIQRSYKEALNVGKSREKLVQNLRYLLAESQQLFTSYYAEIDSLRNDMDQYSQQTLQRLIEAKKNLTIKVEQLIAKEQSTQSEYQQFFLEYRLLITQQIDPICDALKIFSFRSQELRSTFIELLTSLEDKHPKELKLARHELDEQFKSLLHEIQQMQVVEQANKEARQYIKKLAKSTQFNFFQEAAEEAEQTGIRAIGDNIRQVESFSLMLQQIESIKNEYHSTISHLSEVERDYLNLREQTLNSIDTDVKFSINSLNLNAKRINELFVPESSYRLISGQLNSYDPDANQAVLNQLSTNGTLLNISELGDTKREPVKIETDLNLEKLYENLSRKVTELGISNIVGFIPVLIDESERFDIPAILFFCLDPDKARPELTGILEVLQQGKLIYIRKLINILPLPSQVLNNLLEGYKMAFRSNSQKVMQLISDDFLANKLKLDFQAQMAQAMTGAKQKMRCVYLEELKQDVLTMVTSGYLERNVFLKIVDNLIIEALDAWIGFEENNEPFIW